jgi:hypothetical protein
VDAIRYTSARSTDDHRGVNFATLYAIRECLETIRELEATAGISQCWVEREENKE